MKIFNGNPSNTTVRNTKCKFLIYHVQNLFLGLYTMHTLVLYSYLCFHIEQENLSNIGNNGVFSKAVHIEGVGVYVTILIRDFICRDLTIGFWCKTDFVCMFPSPTKRHWVYVLNVVRKGYSNTLKFFFMSDILHWKQM